MNEHDNEYAAGYLEGEKYVNPKPIYLLFGILLGILAVIITAFYHEKPPQEALADKSSSYILGFNKGFQDKSRSKNIIQAIIGAIISIIGWSIYFGMRLYPR